MGEIYGDGQVNSTGKAVADLETGDVNVDHEYDVAIIGGGHNGLTCGAYLAKRGMDVILIERRPFVGGATQTEEFFPGHMSDPYSTVHIYTQASPALDDLELERFGLEYIEVDPFMFCPFPDGEYLTFYKDVDRTAEEIARISEHDAEAYPEFIEREGEKKKLYSMLSFMEPPNIRDAASMLDFLDPESEEHLEEMVRSTLASASQVYDEWFESDHVKGALSYWTIQLGLGPDDKGSGMNAGSIARFHETGLKFPKGGSGMLARSLGKALQHFGGSILTDCGAEEILLDNGSVDGVKLEDGEVIRASTVISSLAPGATFGGLINDSHLDDELKNKVERTRSTAILSTMHVPLSGLPEYTAYPHTGEQPEACHQGCAVISPSDRYVSDAYRDAAQGIPANNPTVMMLIHSVNDPSRVPDGDHIMHLAIQNTPYDLKNGLDWDDYKEDYADRIFDVVSEYVPNFRDIAEDRHLITPLDLERELGLPRGCDFYIDMHLDQMFGLRPIPGMARYRTPFDNLYLTGASTHPGGGVTTAPGINTANAILSDRDQDPIDVSSTIPE